MTTLSECRFCPKCGDVIEAGGQRVTRHGEARHECRGIYPQHIPAGPDLDLLIWTRVMGKTKPMPIGNDYDHDGGWAPSTDIVNAWEVVEHFRGLGMVPVVYPVADGWCCLVVKSGPCVCIGMIDVDTLGPEGCGYGDTAPLAICRAALSFVGSSPETSSVPPPAG